MAGPNYYMLVVNTAPLSPLVLNRRIYSCNLIRNDIPFRWRGRYNEDTDLSIRMLKAGWVTVLFNALLQWKMTTQSMSGGNTDTIYKDGTGEKSAMLVRMHPDVTRPAFKWGHEHHYVDYAPFKGNKLRRRVDAKVSSKPDEFGMVLTHRDGHAPQPDEAAC